MKNAVILHGTGSSPDENWFSWLDKELTAKGLQVWLPQLPKADHPSLATWSQFVHEQCPFPLDENTLVVGHSSGGVLALILVQQNEVPIGAVAAVSAFRDNEFLKWEALNGLFDVPFDFKAMSKGARKILMLHSDTDPYVPLEQAEYLAKNAGAELVVIPGQGHFNVGQSESYRSFPRLIELLKERRML